MKTNQAQVYRDKMNHLEEQLTQENREYFSDLRIYMTVAGVFVDEAELNLQLYQMEADLLAAQADGVSALDFFGNQPQEMADELLRHTKKTSGKHLLGMLFLVIGILWGINLLGDFSTQGTMLISMPQYLVSAGFGLIGVGLLFWILKRSVFTFGVAALQSLKTQMAVAAVFIVVVAGQMAAGLLFVDTGVLRLSFPFDMLLLGAIALILTFALVKTKAELFYPLGLFLYALVGIGVIQRLLVEGQVAGSHWRMIQMLILVGAVVIALIWQVHLSRGKR